MFRSRAAVLALCATSLLGCAAFQASNVPIDRIDPSQGYRVADASQHRDAGDIFVLIAFSGGGTRAAAFAYGVLEELRDTPVVVDGEQRRLLDEVDTVSGVSGGSFPAAYYGLFGDRIFEEFEPRFLRRNIQREILLRALLPWNLVRLSTASLSRSDLATEIYHANVFDGATFADLAAADGPRIYINATDLADGVRFTFSQGQFDVICSDVGQFPIARAVAASSAVPGLLSPVTLQNHAGECGYEIPPDLAAAREMRDTDPRRYRAAEDMLVYLNVAKKRYVHLVDGGISDNLGVRASLELSASVGGPDALMKLFGISRPRHLLMIVVNAERDSDPGIDLSSASPSLAGLFNSVSGAQIRRYNFETIQLARDAVRAAAERLSEPGSPVSGHFALVDFDRFPDDARRDYFRLLPTSFYLPDSEIDALRSAGRELLRSSQGFQDFLSNLQ